MKQLLTLISLISLSFSIAQNHVFTVLATKGENKVISTSKTAVLKAGDKLNATDKLFIKENGYVGLLHKNGQTLELRDNKAILVASLAQKIGSTSTSSKYTDFLFNNTKKTKHNYNITAAVERQPGITLIANEKTEYIKEIPLNIYWKQPLKKTDANIIPALTDLTETKIAFKHNDTIATIDFSNASSPLLKFEVRNMKSNHSSNTILTPYTKDTKEILKEYNTLISSLDTTKATDLLILVTFFDSYNLPQYTTSTLLEILQLEPNIPQYRKLLTSYITENN